MFSSIVLFALCSSRGIVPESEAFTTALTHRPKAELKNVPLFSSPTTDSEVIDEKENDRLKRKQEILNLLGIDRSASSSQNKNGEGSTLGYDAVLACPVTKDPLRISSESPLMEDGASGVKVSLRTKRNDDATTMSYTYRGRTDTFYNLLEGTTDNMSSSADENKEEDTTTDTATLFQDVASSLLAFVPPPLRSVAAMAGVDTYVPMRDLFTSPAVSFAYERGWRQGFAQAGFPGADKEFELVRDFFEPAVRNNPHNNVIVDMSCATGLFTRRLAKSGEYTRVLGCDYSESMLTESRRRISSDPELSITKKTTATQLELVRCDVANIPMRSDSVDALHAGAAMHCWPELEEGLADIHRVLKPNGGRFFASTFLSAYFKALQGTEGNNVAVQQQAFQYFESAEELKAMVVKAGFKEDKVTVEVLAPACAIIRCEK